jgi:tetratricopeptide (TPR) repeat protein
MGNQVIQMQKLFTEGSELLQTGNAAEALVRFQAARDIDPSNAILHLHAGAALHDLGRYEEAITCYRHAIDIAPSMGEAHNNLGNSLMALGRFAEAADSFSRSSVLLASSPVPPAARATALQAQGRVAEAEADCRRALMLDPAFAAAHWNLAINLLLQGRYMEGWQEYEWRWQKPDFTSPCRHTDVPLWDGSSLEGRTILLHAEQGFGDAIQFARYIPLVAQCGGMVVVECHAQLVQLLQTVKGVQAVIPFGAPLPPFTCQAPLLSLPRIFGTTLQTIPSRCPYVSITVEYRKKWAALMHAHPATLRVGLVWAGKSYPDPLRSCRLAELALLAAVPDVTFYSLQLGAGSEQAGSPPSGMRLIDVTDRIHDFADTAALIEQLDLVISIDTAVAHLAGALGKPAFVLLPFAPDWRWLLERSDSPWYPSMRIFRQKQPGDWGEAMIRIHAAIDTFVRQNKKSSGGAPKD